MTEFIDFIVENKYLIIIYFIPFLLICISLIKQKNRLVKNPIIPKYGIPKDVHPTLIGIFIDGEFNERDFMAGIIDLAVNGLIKIEKYFENGAPRYFFKDLSSNKKINNNVRRFFYENLFNKIKRRENEKLGIFPYLHKEEISGIYKSMVFYGSMDSNIEKYFLWGILPKKYLAIRFAMFLLLFIAFGIIIPVFIFVSKMEVSDFKISLDFFIFFIISGFLLTFGIFHNGKSKKGEELIYDIKCYKEFLETVELGLGSRNDYEKHASYAMSLGVSEKWTNKFIKTMKAPDWIYLDGMENMSKDMLNIIQIIRKT